MLAARSVHLMSFLLRPGWREVVDWAWPKKAAVAGDGESTVVSNG